MTVIWGTNFSVVKPAFRELNPQAFNAVRMIIASIVFLAIMKIVPRWTTSDIFSTPAPITRRDWVSIALLGTVGHFFYQYFFIGGLALTTVANSSLLLAATPVMIAILSAILGHDRIAPLHWVGAAMSLTGIYVIVAYAGHGISIGGSSLRGDLMMFGAVCCWAIYTMGSRPLMERHSPVGVTGLSMAIGTLLYVPLVWSNVTAANWAAVSMRTWIALTYSALFALCVAYTIWYVAVREIGSARTSVYSNIVPIVAMLTAVVFLGERLTVARLLGAGCVLVGVALTRIGRSAPVIPAEE
jgi:drug/metabolite transporter (DMT)-like permease